MLGFGGFNAFAVLHAREVGLDRPGLVFLVFAGVVVLVRLLGRTVPDRLGARLAASAACAAVACGLVVVAAWQTEAGVLVGTAIFAVGQALAYPAAALLAMSRAPASERSAAVAAVIAFVDVALVRRGAGARLRRRGSGLRRRLLVRGGLGCRWARAS